MEWLIGFGGAAIALGSFILGLSRHSRESKHEAAQGAAEGATIKKDIEYIKNGIDSIRGDIKAQGEKVDRLSERVTRAEESVKSAHHRIDEILKERTS
jgi:peptidoglycan hydrolase CwlO-like protein